MILLKKTPRFLIIILPVCFSVTMLVKCVSETGQEKKNSGIPGFDDFAGSASCAGCHKQIFDAHSQTAHGHTSQPASLSAILGSLEKDQNEFSYDPMTKVAMEKRGDSVFQVEYVSGEQKRKSRFDIVVGSGKKGQSYLSWKNNSLIQMPVTYFTPEQKWSSSPGFDPRKVAFNRVVTSRCLECHSTFFQTTSAKGEHPEKFDRAESILGIQCEKCHGPGVEHVSFHSQHPNEKQARYIVNTGKLSRQLNLDLCGLCHNGRLNKTKPSFAFQAGDSLMDFFEHPVIPAQFGGIDVHGNQLGMLSASKCFTASGMTCMSCHDVHRKEQNAPKLFSSRCATCHKEGKTTVCSLTHTVGNIINDNCIDCHMPRQPSQSIVVYLEGRDVPTPAKLRTHHIKIYSEETEKVLSMLKKDSTKAAISKSN